MTESVNVINHSKLITSFLPEERQHQYHTTKTTNFQCFRTIFVSFELV